MQISRLFEIIYVLLHKEKVSSQELAEQLGVSRRTIIRDIDVLSSAGIPVYTERGKGGGIRLLPDFVLSKSLLDEKEQNEILNALQGLAHIKPNDTQQVLHKVSATFNKRATDWLAVDFSDWSFENQYFEDFKTGILEHRIASFDYHNSFGDETTQRIEPIQLLFKHKSWYLRGYSIPKKAMRMYKLTRVKNLRIHPEHFKLRREEVYQDKYEDDLKIADVNPVILHIDKMMAYRVYDDFSENELEKQVDGSFVATVDFPVDNWLHGFILSYGNGMKVVEPVELAMTIKEKAQGICGLYEDEGEA